MSLHSQLSIALRFLVTLAIPVASTASQAQTTFTQPQGNYGGQIIHEMVPYQPEAVFVPPGQDQTPIFLDQSPEFCLPTETVTGQPILIQQPVPAVKSNLPPGVRKSLFQKLFFSGSYLPQFEDDSLGVSDLEAGIVFGVPFIRFNTPLLITPRFAVHYLDGPATPDLPARVYDAELNLRHIRKFGEGPWAMMAAVTLGHYSDFESSDADAFRVTGQAFAIYESSPRTKWIMGVVYLNREDISIVPALGVIYEPTPDLKFEVTLPRPRISWRLPDGAKGPEHQRWAYIGGEFGGGIWSIERPTTLTQDLLTYSDFRVVVGIEKKAPLGGINHRLEAGYVFGREIEFSSATPDVELDDSMFVRAGITY